MIKKSLYSIQSTIRLFSRAGDKKSAQDTALIFGYMEVGCLRVTAEVDDELFCPPLDAASISSASGLILGT